VTEPFRAPEHWTFETAYVAGNFDAHVREQLPWYDLATSAARILGAHYLPRGGRAYDIGSGNGNMARAFEAIVAERGIDFTSIESSREMAKTFKGPGRLLVTDACEASYDGADLVVSFLAMIFIPPSERGRLMARIVDGLKPGGAFLMLERITPEDGYVSLACARITMAQKQLQGADPGDIYRKEMSLIGLQRPIERAALLKAGFSEWFRLANFAGFIYEKREQFI